VPDKSTARSGGQVAGNGELGTGGNGSWFIIGHVDGPLELHSIGTAERGRLGAVFSESRLRRAQSPPSAAFALILAANEPCLFNSHPGEHTIRCVSQIGRD